MPIDKTLNLELPYIYTNQAQKEVSVNEAFTILDSVWNTGAISRALTAPPGSPALKRSYILSAVKGTFTLTSVAVNLKRSYLLSAVKSTFTLNGVNAGLLNKHLLISSAGSFVLTGNDAALTTSAASVVPQIIMC